MHIPHLTQMLDALGPDWIDIAAVDRLGDQTWLIAFDDDTEIAVELNEAAHRLVLTSPLGRAPVDRRFVVYEALLGFNALWREHEGCRMALNGAAGEIMLIQDVRADGLTPATLQEALQAFAVHARTWHEFVVAEPRALTLPPPHPMLGLIA
jgi:hypothetical protein